LALFLFIMQVELTSPCKVNLILNILGKRPDGFHDLETVMHPVPIFDSLNFSKKPTGIELTCNHAELPTDSGNLVYRAAEKFLEASKITEGVAIHLEKRIPLAAGLGGGSANAAVTLAGLNELFGYPLRHSDLHPLAASLGSDVPFFLQNKPALATGRGEQVVSLNKFPALSQIFILLIHPGFGVSTAWAYKNLSRFTADLNGQQGRAKRLVDALNEADLEKASGDFYNSLEAPVLEKFPLLRMFQNFLRENGAAIAMMSGSGSTTFALVKGSDKAAMLEEEFIKQFGTFCWTARVEL
jgi:4-diphosphocytidyl-2-C-methyl-D-erythritol kinase